jgi:hypothetical protein
MSLRCDSSEAFPVGHKNAIRFPKTGSGLSRYFLLTRPGQPFGHIKGGTALHGVSRGSIKTLSQMAKFDRTTGGQSCSFPSVWQCGKVTGSRDEFLYPIRT